MITKVTSLLGSWVVLLGAWQASAADLEISIPIQITHAQNFDPSPSPDGKKLVFISMLSGKEQLFTMDADGKNRSEEHTSELQSPYELVCRLRLEKKKLRE